MANVATAEMLFKKRRVERKVEFTLPGENGSEQVELLFRSIGAKEYDELVTKYPPTAQQRKDGLSYNIDMFAPALLSRVCIDPDMNYDAWKELWESEDWNRGELMHLYVNAADVCTAGMTVDPTVSG